MPDETQMSPAVKALWPYEEAWMGSHFSGTWGSWRIGFADMSVATSGVLRLTDAWKHVVELPRAAYLPIDWAARVLELPSVKEWTAANPNINPKLYICALACLAEKHGSKLRIAIRLSEGLLCVTLTGEVPWRAAPESDRLFDAVERLRWNLDDLRSEGKEAVWADIDTYISRHSR